MLLEMEAATQQFCSAQRGLNEEPFKPHLSHIRERLALLEVTLVSANHRISSSIDKIDGPYPIETVQGKEGLISETYVSQISTLIDSVMNEANRLHTLADRLDKVA